MDSGEELVSDMVKEELLLEQVQDDYPGLVKEALTENKEIRRSCCVSLSSNGYVRMIVGRNLFIWSYKNEEKNFGSPKQLTLPQSTLPYTTLMTCIYKCVDEAYPSPVAIAVSPEGSIRLWPSISRPFNDSYMELNSEVVLSLLLIDDQSHDGIHFLLSTTTCSFFLVSLNSVNAGLGSGDRSYPSFTVNYRLIYSDINRGIGSRLSSIVFGGMATERASLLKALVYRQMSCEADFNMGADENSCFPETFILAVKAMKLELYSISRSSRLWSCDLSKIIATSFAHEFTFSDENAQLKFAESLNVWTIDMVNFRDGVLGLFSCISNSAALDRDSSLLFGLAYLMDYDCKNAPSMIDWFQILSFDYDNYKSGDKESSMKISFHMPARVSASTHNRMEGAMIVTPKNVYSLCFPVALETGACVKTHSLKLKDELIGSGNDCDFTYLFFKSSGLSRIRLLPRGFDAYLTQTIDMGPFNFRRIPDSFSSEAHSLANAFLLFVHADLPASQSIVLDLLSFRCATIASLCVDFAIGIVNNVSFDRKWIDDAQTKISSSNPVAIDMFRAGFLIDSQKKRILTMFILFIHSMQLGSSFNRIVPSILSDSRSSRSQLAELLEKLEIANVFHQECGRQVMVETIKHAIEVEQSSNGECLFALASSGYYLHKITNVECFFTYLRDVQQLRINSEETLHIAFEFVEDATFIVAKAVDAIQSIRQQNLLNFTKDYLWTSEKVFIDGMITQVDIAISIVQRFKLDKSKMSLFYENIIKIASFTLQQMESAHSNRSKLIKKFFDVDVDLAIILAKKFDDYSTLIGFLNRLPYEKMIAQIEEFRSSIKSRYFDLLLYDFYFKNGYINQLRKETSNLSDEFFATHAKISWLRYMDRGNYDMAQQCLKTLAEDCDDDVTLKKLYLSFAKLCLLSTESVNKDCLASVQRTLQLIKLQEDIPHDLINPDLMSYTCDGTMKIKSFGIVELIHICLRDTVESRILSSFSHAFRIFLLLFENGTSSADSDTVNELRKKIWVAIIKFDIKHALISNLEAIRSSKFCSILKWICDEDFHATSKLFALPDMCEVSNSLPELSNQPSIISLLVAEATTTREHLIAVLKEESTFHEKLPYRPPVKRIVNEIHGHVATFYPSYQWN